MPTYLVTAQADGIAQVYVSAANEDEAAKIAYEEHLTGITIEGGSASWEITSISESESAA